MVTKAVTLSETRDLPILLDLWKWKLLTTAALTAKHFEGSSPITAHKRLWLLEHGGYVKARSIGDTGRAFAWCLDKRGFGAVRDALPALRSEGYKSEHLAHDLLVSAFHLGDWFCATPADVRLFSEQQLRRYELEFFPPEVPKSELHRPDGWIILGQGSDARAVAVEVELTPKKRTDYEQVCEFYLAQNVTDVLWLVSRPGLAKRIDGIFRRYHHAAGAHAHSFLTHADFAARGWGAPFTAGKRQGATVRAALGNPPETSPNLVSASFLLDTRKAPHRSRGSGLLAPAMILN